jgi:hypothetical protein
MRKDVDNSDYDAGFLLSLVEELRPGQFDYLCFRRFEPQGAAVVELVENLWAMSDQDWVKFRAKGHVNYTK